MNKPNFLGEYNPDIDAIEAKIIVREIKYSENPMRHCFPCPKCNDVMLWYSNGWNCVRCGYWMGNVSYAV